VYATVAEVHVRSVIVLMLAILLLVPSGEPAAFEREERSLELGVLTGVTFFLDGEDNVDYTGSLPTGSSGIHAPLTPALRLTFWSDTPVIADFGASYFSSDVFGDRFSALNLELGIGLRTTYPSRVVPSASVLFGFVSWSTEATTTDAYLGGQVGMRAFINGRTSFRTHLGYRHTLQGPDSGFEIDAIEVSLGLGVYL
jgi:hypothetical protein